MRRSVWRTATVWSLAADPDLWLYRDRTIAILRRYLRLAVEVGRLPALLGREFFRTRVTSYHTQTFEDTVIFVHDVERCLGLLNDAEMELIAMIVMQEHPHYEAAQMLRCTRRTIVRSYGEVLDRLSEIFLEREILTATSQKKLRLRRKLVKGVKLAKSPQVSESRQNIFLEIVSHLPFEFAILNLDRENHQEAR